MAENEEPTRDPGGVWCRKCGSYLYKTKHTYRALEGNVRQLECSICGNHFASIETILETDTPKADASRKFTLLSELFLPVQLKP